MSEAIRLFPFDRKKAGYRSIYIVYGVAVSASAATHSPSWPGQHFARNKFGENSWNYAPCSSVPRSKSFYEHTNTHEQRNERTNERKKNSSQIFSTMNTDGCIRTKGNIRGRKWEREKSCVCVSNQNKWLELFAHIFIRVLIIFGRNEKNSAQANMQLMVGQRKKRR